MTNTIALFQISTEEDLRFQLDFVGLDLSGRTLKVNVRERSSSAIKAVLVAPTYLTLVNTGNLTAQYPKASMSAWARGEYEADIVDESGGSATRIMAVRFTFDEPGKLVYGVRGNQATVTWGGNQATVTAIGGVGPPGPANTLTIGDVDTLETGEPATAELTGDAPAQVLNLGLPKGNTGTAATIAVGDVTTLAPGEPAAVTNTGTSGAAVFDFDIPAGAAATISVGDVTEGAPGSAAVVNVGSSSAAVFDFTIPAGTAASIAIGDVTTSLPGSDAEVINVGTSAAAVFDFVIPRGDQGPPGSVTDGDKGDITVSGGGTVWEIDANAVGDAELRDSAALSVIGRSANSSGDPADMAAGTDGHVLRRSGTALGFGTVATAGIANAAITLAKMANLTAPAIIGRATVGAGVPEELTPALVRGITGQKPVAVYDSTISGSAVSAIDIPLLAAGTFSSFTIKADIVPNPAVADFYVGLRVSADGVTYASGGSAYLYSTQRQIGTLIAGAVDTSSSFMYASGSVESTNAAALARVRADFHRGASAAYPSLVSRSNVYDPTGTTGQWAINGYYITNGAITHIRLLTDTGGAGIGIGSRIVVEGW